MTENTELKQVPEFQSATIEKTADEIGSASTEIPQLTQNVEADAEADPETKGEVTSHPKIVSEKNLNTGHLPNSETYHKLGFDPSTGFSWGNTIENKEKGIGPS